jgi:carbamoyl-phosphate synthase small subunit
MKKTYLVFEDGEYIEGQSFGYAGDTSGEVVFTTGMTGYPQSLTDPSFAGQILVFTYPLLGNYGVPKFHLQDKHLAANFESERIWAQGVIVSSEMDAPSHYQMHQSLSEWLNKNKVPGISHIDTRALTQKIRDKGTLRGVITRSKSFDWDPESVKNLVEKTSLGKEVLYKPQKPTGKKLVLLDCGVKHGILRELVGNGYEVMRIPWNEDPTAYLKDADGLFCSNGPGDPKECEITISYIQKALKNRIPFVGVCLGHQLAALALGADTYKLPYGHRGLNQPCQDVLTKKAYVTSQNHGYAVKTKTIPKSCQEWFINLNDNTNEGLQGIDQKIWTTQFHPEGNPGPYDTNWVFGLFNL